MAIFGVLDLEKVVRIGDKTRLKAVRSFVSKDEEAITLVEIEPEAGYGFIDVTDSNSDNWYLDWSYSGTSRSITVTLRITTDGSPVTVDNVLEVVVEADDKLFSNDQDLLEKEAEIMHLLPSGFSSFNYRHRSVKKDILDWFDEMGYRTYDGSKITADEIINVEEVRRWSMSQVLADIYFDNSNANDDKFYQKYVDYKSIVSDTINRRNFGIDLNKDGNQEKTEVLEIASLRLIRR